MSRTPLSTTPMPKQQEPQLALTMTVIMQPLTFPHKFNQTQHPRPPLRKNVQTIMFSWGKMKQAQKLIWPWRFCLSSSWKPCKWTLQIYLDNNNNKTRKLIKQTVQHLTAWMFNMLYFLYLQTHLGCCYCGRKTGDPFLVKEENQERFAAGFCWLQRCGDCSKLLSEFNNSLKLPHTQIILVLQDFVFVRNQFRMQRKACLVYSSYFQTIVSCCLRWGFNVIVQIFVVGFNGMVRNNQYLTCCR